MISKVISLLSLTAVLSGTVGQAVSPFNAKYGAYAAAVGGIALVLTKPVADIAEIVRKTFGKPEAPKQ
jgi:hypothetical protein